MIKTSRVVPAILTEDAKALKTMLKQSENFACYLQLDIMDGKFVPSRSVTWKQISDVDTELPWEAHLMVMEPETQVEGFKKAGARKVVFHFEATKTPRKVIAISRDLKLEVGIAINPETPVSAVLPLVDDVDSVLFLSVNPGFYGAKFIPEVLGKIVELRRSRPGIEIGIDGGIKENNIALAAQKGADVIFVGSAIFIQPDPAESFRRLNALAEEGSRKRSQ